MLYILYGYLYLPVLCTVVLVWQTIVLVGYSNKSKMSVNMLIQVVGTSEIVIFSHSLSQFQGCGVLVQFVDRGCQL